MKIVITGGGTGGHTFPLIAVARKLKEEARIQNVSLELLFIGPKEGSYAMWQEKYIKTQSINAGKLRRYLSLYIFIDIPKILIGLVQAFFYLISLKPNVIFSKGGYGSFAVVIVAWILRIPIIAHESDSTAGLTNRMLARLATIIIVSFPVNHEELPKHKIVQLGNPIRDMRGGSAHEAHSQFNIKSDKPIILVIGGSQGATQINNLILKNLKKLEARYEIIHQVGEKNYLKIQNLPRSTSYHPYSFLNEEQMKNAYAASSLIVSRAGSGSIFEMALVGKPSILIPLASSAGGHQQKNALIYEKEGACLVIDPREATAPVLLKIINSLMDDAGRLNALSSSALAFAKPNAAENIAKLILKYAL